jgi:peptide/nickel transport system substrate-binding protein
VRTRRSFIEAVFGVSSLALLAACGPAPAAPAPTTAASSANATARPAGTAAATGSGPNEWIAILAQEPQAIDPNISSQTSPSSEQAYIHIYDHTWGAFLRDPSAGFKSTPELAQSYTNPDQTTYEFKLRQGVKWQNGDDFTADDIKYSVDDYLQPTKPRAYLNSVFAGVEIVDPYTLRVTTKGPQASVLYQMGLLPIMPKKARTAMGPDAANQKPIGTGPYKVVQWDQGTNLILQANPNYWGGKTFPDKLTMRFISDPTTRMSELKAGNAHIIATPPLSALQDIQSDPTLSLNEIKGGRTMAYKFNITQPPFNDPRVRQAINYAVDRNSIIKDVLQGYAVPMVGNFSAGWMGYDPNLAPYPYDPNKAKSLLAEAGQSGGFTMNFTTSNGVYLKDNDIAQAVAAQLEQVGIKVNIVIDDPNKLIADWGSASFTGAILGPWSLAADPDSMLGTQYYKQKAYQDTQLDALYEKQHSTVDPDQRLAALKNMNKYIHDQALNLEIHSQSEFWASRKGVQWQPIPFEGAAYIPLFRLPSALAQA